MIKFLSFLSVFLATHLYIYGADHYNIIPLVSNQEDCRPNKVLDTTDTGFVLGKVFEEFGDFGQNKLFVYHADFGFKVLDQIPEGATGVMNNHGVIAGIYYDEEEEGEFSYFPWNTKKSAYVYDVMTDHFLDLGTFGFDPNKVDILEVVALSDSGLLLVWFTEKSSYELTFFLYDIHTGKRDVTLPGRPIKMDRNGRVLGIKSKGGYCYFNGGSTRTLPFTPTACNDDGVVSGVVWSKTKAKGKVWQENGQITTFNLLRKPQDAVFYLIEEIWVSGINRSGQLFGNYTLYYQSKGEEIESRREKAFFYDPIDGVKHIGLDIDGYFSANSLNSQGEIVGCFETQEEECIHGPYGDYIVSGEPVETAFIWDSKEGLRDLKTLIPTDSDWETLNKAMHVADDGIIVGEGIYKGEECSFLLIPQKK